MTEKSVTTNLMMMSIPSLPEGWAVHALQNYFIDGESWWSAAIYRPHGRPRSGNGKGKFPREAILRALDNAEAVEAIYAKA